MTHCTCPAPSCAIDHAVDAEREAAEIAAVKAVLFRLRAFREDAECDARDDDLALLHAALDANDILESHRIRVAIWDAHADSWITTHTERGLRQPIAAAHIVKRQFQRDEARSFPHRSAASPAPSPCGVAAERPFPPPAPVRPLDAGSSPAAGLSSDTRVAA